MNDNIIELLEDLLGDHRKHHSNNNQISFDCPVCSAYKGVDYDGKGNLEVNYSLGVYKCWACSEEHNTKGSITKLFYEHGNKSQIKNYLKGNFVYYDDYIKTTPKEEKKSITLPNEYVKLSECGGNILFKNAINYLEKRSVTKEIIDRYNIGYCVGGQYKNRILIPSYDENGELNYFITRSITEGKYKYLNPKIDKTKIIFNEHLIDWNKPIYIVEGVFDHIVVKNSIPLLGKKLYPLIFEKLYFKAKNYIIIALDSDANEDALIIRNKLNSGNLYNKILINNMPDDFDISLFNQVYGGEALSEWLTVNNYLIHD